MNNTIIETGNFRGINFVIRQIANYFSRAHYCAYIYAEKCLEEGDCFGGQEITFSYEASEVSWADSQLGKYVIGWDYNHCYNDQATIEEVRRDVKDFINEFLDNPPKDGDEDSENEDESLAELKAGLESEDTGPSGDNEEDDSDADEDHRSPEEVKKLRYPYEYKGVRYLLTLAEGPEGVTHYILRIPWDRPVFGKAGQGTLSSGWDIQVAEVDDLVDGPFNVSWVRGFSDYTVEEARDIVQDIIDDLLSIRREEEKPGSSSSKLLMEMAWKAKPDLIHKPADLDREIHESDFVDKEHAQGYREMLSTVKEIIKNSPSLETPHKSPEDFMGAASLDECPPADPKVEQAMLSLLDAAREPFCLELVNNKGERRHLDGGDRPAPLVTTAIRYARRLLSNQTHFEIRWCSETDPMPEEQTQALDDAKRQLNWLRDVVVKQDGGGGLK